MSIRYPWSCAENLSRNRLLQGIGGTRYLFWRCSRDPRARDVSSTSRGRLAGRTSRAVSRERVPRFVLGESKPYGIIDLSFGRAHMPFFNSRSFPVRAWHSDRHDKLTHRESQHRFAATKALLFIDTDTSHLLDRMKPDMRPFSGSEPCLVSIALRSTAGRRLVLRLPCQRGLRVVSHTLITLCASPSCN